ncbi:hypothetical protein FRC03_009646 [Tulasnella sp. 419]|nr:hypothetical protein FRC03_009646 [Tulasnella sp. 419]
MEDRRITRTLERAIKALQRVDARLVSRLANPWYFGLIVTSNSEYMLWTDEMARELIKEHYPWFLSTYDGYGFNIQRADAIRYFVLHRYGGVYMDLDIGCIRSIDPLLKYDVILPKTIPVGVSNDLMFAAKGHPFMEQTIRGLITFDHNWILNYPTVMFSTGPMFLSAEYGLYTASHPPTPSNPGGDIRILPKSLYGKNAKPGEAPNSFFEHYYGSSWHEDDAWLWTFLGVWGTRLMYVASVFLVIAVVRLYWTKRKGHGAGRRRRLMFGRYEVVLPRFHYGRDGAQLDLGPYSLVAPHGASSPTSSSLPSPTSESVPRFPIVPVPFDVNPPSPTLSTISTSSNESRALDAFRRAGSWVMNVPHMFMSARSSSTSTDVVDDRKKSRRRSARDIMFFLPAIFTPSSATSTPATESLSLHPTRRSSGSPTPLRHRVDDEEAGESVSLLAASAVADSASAATSRAASRRSSFNIPRSSPSPPPYSIRSKSPAPATRYGS